MPFVILGGAIRTVIIGNLRAAVMHGHRFDAELNLRLEEFCQHCKTVILPCKPKMSRRKAKVEPGV